MYELIIDPFLCAACGNCDRRLPGLHFKVTGNRLLINENNSIVDFVAIFRAIGDCYMDALTLRRLDGQPA